MAHTTWEKLMKCEITGTGFYLAPETEAEHEALKDMYQKLHKGTRRIPLTRSTVAGKAIEYDFKIPAWCHKLRNKESLGLFISLGEDMADRD